MAIGHQWQKHIGFALADQTGQDESVQSVTEAKTQVLTQASEQGIPWVQGTLDPNTHQTMAGGKNQAPIHVVYDTLATGD